MLVGAPEHVIAQFEADGEAGGDPKLARSRGGRKGFLTAGHVLDLSQWDELSDAVMLTALRQRMACDPLFRRILAEVARQRVLLQHFERSGSESYWGGCVSKATGSWHGRNRLGEMLNLLATVCVRIENGEAPRPHSVTRMLSRSEQLQSWRQALNSTDQDAGSGPEQEFHRIILIRHAQSEFNKAEESFLDTRPELRETPEHWDTDEVYDPHIWVGSAAHE